MKHNSIKIFPVVRRARAIEYLIMVFALNLVPICMVIEGYRIQTVFKYVALVSELVFLLLDIFIFRKPVLLMFNFVYFDEAGVHCLRPFQRDCFSIGAIVNISHSLLSCLERNIRLVVLVFLHTYQRNGWTVIAATI